MSNTSHYREIYSLFANNLLIKQFIDCILLQSDDPKRVALTSIIFITKS